MKVYRYLSKKELMLILSGDKTCLGKEFNDEKYRKINNHKYKKGVKYLHFFKNKKDIKLIQNECRKFKREFYICEFDIPIMTLLFNSGYGVYDSSGYDYDFIKAKEFAIPVEKFETCWLTNYEKDENHKIEDDCLLP